VSRSSVALTGITIAVALAGGVVYLAWPGSWSWWIGSLFALPLCVLLAVRAGRDTRGARSDFDDPAAGPWGAP
jgi:uncharacterized membrane protein YgaE (UPF0421/DUF939 family)